MDALDAAGCETARLDAELLLSQATGWDRARLAAEPEARLPVGASREFAEMVRRRVRREQIAYILGRKGFRRIELLVDRRVLIPRPETELLVEVAVELGAREILDVGTGSGAIALASPMSSRTPRSQPSIRRSTRSGSRSRTTSVSALSTAWTWSFEGSAH